MFEKLGAEARDIVVSSQEIAQSMGHGEVRGEHLLLALFERMDKGLASEFADIGITYEQLLSAVQTSFPSKDSVLEGEFVELSPESQIIILRSILASERLDSKSVLPVHILSTFEWYAIVEYGNFYAWELLKKNAPEIQLRAIFAKLSNEIVKHKSSVLPQFQNKDWFGPEEVTINHEVFELAKSICQKHGHNKLNSLFILAALAMQSDTVASDVLETIGLNPNRINDEIVKRFGKGPSRGSFEVFISPGAKEIFAKAGIIAAELQSESIETEHLLLAMVRVGSKFDGCAASALIEETGRQNSLHKEIIESLKKTHLLSAKEQKQALQNLRKNAKKRSKDLLHSAQKSDEKLITPQHFFSQSTLKLLFNAKETATRLKQSEIHPEHLFLSLFSIDTVDLTQIFSTLKYDLVHIESLIEQHTTVSEAAASFDEISFSVETKDVLEIAFKEARQLGVEKIEPIHILFALSNMFADQKLTGVLKNLFESLDDISVLSSSIMQLLKEQSELRLPELRKQESAPPFEEKSLYKIPHNFSGLSIRVVENAHFEAKKLGYPHIEPEHLLLGIAKETSSEISVHLQSRGISVHNMREDLTKFKDRGPGGSRILNPSEKVKEIFRLASEEAEDLVQPEDLLGYLILSMDLTTINLLRSIGLEDMLEGAGTYTPPMVLFEFLNKSKLDNYFVSDSLKVVFRSQELARQCGHKFAGPEHLLVALLENHSDMSISLLRKCGVTMKEIRQTFRKLVGIGNVYETNEIPLSPNAIDLLREAADLVDELNSTHLQLGHLLACILRIKPGATAELLKEYDIPADIDDQIVIALGGKSEK